MDVTDLVYADAVKKPSTILCHAAVSPDFFGSFVKSLLREPLVQFPGPRRAALSLSSIGEEGLLAAWLEPHRHHSRTDRTTGGRICPHLAKTPNRSGVEGADRRIR